MNDYIENGKITERGQALIDWLDALEAKTADDLNRQPGNIRHYLVQVRESGIISREAWLKDYPNAVSAAERTMNALTEADRKDEEQQAASAKIVEALEALQQVVEAQAAEIAALKEAQTPAAKPKRKAKAVEESVADADDDEADDDGDAE